jgi:hypothetical protein
MLDFISIMTSEKTVYGMDVDPHEKIDRNREL